MNDIDEAATDPGDYQAADRDVQARWVYDLLVVAEALDLDVDPYDAPDAEHVARYVRDGFVDTSIWPRLADVLAGKADDERATVQQRLTAALDYVGPPPPSQW